MISCGQKTDSIIEINQDKKNIVLGNELDLLFLLDKAEILAEQTNYVSPTFETLNDESYWGIFQHSTSSIIYKNLYIGKNSKMDFFVGMREKTWDQCADGVVFQILAKFDGNKEIVIFEKLVDPLHNKEDRKWQNVSIPLEKCEEKIVDLIFKILPGHQNNLAYDWALWGRPVIQSDGKQYNSNKMQKEKKTNVILITLDTVRKDYIGCYGNDWIQTKHIDEMAQKGVLFKNAYSAAYTTNPSHASILTSLMPFEHGVIGNDYNLAHSIPRLPQILKEEKYVTGAFVSVYHLDKQNSGMSLWFDHYDEVPKKWPEEFGSMTYNLTRSASTVTSAAIDWLEKIYEENFFLWIHYYDPHSPYIAEGNYHRMYYQGDPRSDTHTSMQNVKFNLSWDVNLLDWIHSYNDLEYFKKEYGSEITMTDDQIGRLVNALKRMDLYENTLIVLTADHGESFGEHNLYFDHWTNFNTDIHVPLIISYPPMIPQGVEVEAIASGIDIAPTILDMLEINDNFLAKNTFQGKSLRPYWESKEVTENRILTSDGLFYKDIAAWNERYKLIWDLYTTGAHDDFIQKEDRITVYDIVNDPQEQNPIGCFLWLEKMVDHDPAMAAFAINKSDPFNVQISKRFLRIKFRVEKKKIPSVDELQSWFLADNDYAYIIPEKANDERFYKIVIEIMEKLKLCANPQPLKERLKSIYDVNAMDDADFESMQITDPKYQEALQGNLYTAPEIRK
jgi:arylsulfatase A-like enzyme